MFKKCFAAVAIFGAAVGAQAFDLGHVSSITSGNGGSFFGSLNSVGVAGFAGVLNFFEVDFTNPPGLGPSVGFCGDVTANFPPPDNWDVNIYNPASGFGNGNVTAAASMLANISSSLG